MQPVEGRPNGQQVQRLGGGPAEVTATTPPGFFTRSLALTAAARSELSAGYRDLRSGPRCWRAINPAVHGCARPFSGRTAPLVIFIFDFAPALHNARKVPTSEAWREYAVFGRNYEGSTRPFRRNPCRLSAGPRAPLGNVARVKHRSSF